MERSNGKEQIVHQFSSSFIMSVAENLEDVVIFPSCSDAIQKYFSLFPSY